MIGQVLGLLHTAAAHRSRFDGLLRELAPTGVIWTHSVREELLREALDSVPELHRMTSISAALKELRADGATQILCTCSSIGSMAETSGASLQLPTLRVDRPMAEAAVQQGDHILVVACLPSTLAPTMRLLRECAAAGNREIKIETMLLSDVWHWFQDGDEATFVRAIADAILEARPKADALVLAQASMVQAAGLLTELAMPVLSSPRLGVATALSRLTGRQIAA
jgi:hypothetical protein